jgi:hypothetical protein
MVTAVTHLVWVVSGGVKVQPAATAPVGVNDNAANKTAGIAPDIYALIDFLLSTFQKFISARIFISVCDVFEPKLPPTRVCGLDGRRRERRFEIYFAPSMSY